MEDAIIERLQYLAPKDSEGDSYLSLPFALKYLDEDNDDRMRYYSCISTDGRIIELYSWEWDEGKGDEVEYVYTLFGETILDLYKKLYRMGFFDDNYILDFKH